MGRAEAVPPWRSRGGASLEYAWMLVLVPGAGAATARCARRAGSSFRKTLISWALAGEGARGAQGLAAEVQEDGGAPAIYARGLGAAL